MRSFRDVVLELVRGGNGGMTYRQTALLLTAREHNGDPLFTVRGMANTLNVSKPVITRAVDALDALGFMVRRPDPGNRRSVLIAVTKKGQAFADRLLGA